MKKRKMEEEKMNRAEAIKVAREALAAYEKTVQAAEEVKKLGPPSGLGTCIMTDKGTGFYGVRYQCSECQHEEHGAASWKFCPHCGAGIVRFDKREGDAELVRVTVEQDEPKPETLARSVTQPTQATQETLSPFRKEKK
jgi:hypothetical protein